MESSDLKKRPSVDLGTHNIYNPPMTTQKNHSLTDHPIKDLSHLIEGYRLFKEKYVDGTEDFLSTLSKGQKPQVMVLACCDARVDPALLLQCKPGDLFVARSIANFVMPFNRDNEVYQGISAALEFGICLLKVPNLIILGHSHCGGIEAFLHPHTLPTNNDFISRWLQGIDVSEEDKRDTNTCAKAALLQSYQNCLTFPWIRSRVLAQSLKIHLWFFDIESGTLSTYRPNMCEFQPL